jgi:hypothetical protein
MDLIGKIIRTDAQSFITRTSDESAGVDARCSLQRRDCDGVFGAGALRAGGAAAIGARVLSSSARQNLPAGLLINSVEILPVCGVGHLAHSRAGP